MKPVDALLEIVRSEGVRHVFGNPGTTELPFLEALVDAPDLPYVLGLQEGSVVAMADGYARATGRTAFVNLHVAAGLANGLIGLLNASRSRTPMVVLAGQQDQRHLQADPMLAGDLVGLASPAVKSAVEVHQPYDLPVLLRRAFALARRTPSGPVFVSVPMDVLSSSSSVDVPAVSRVSAPGASSDVSSAVRILAEATSPVIVAGDGVGRDGVVPALVSLAERLGAPVWSQPMFDGVDFPGSHPLYAGMLPPRHEAIRAELEAHDVVVIVGCHAFMPHHWTPGSPIPDGCAVVQLDADPAEIGRNFPVAAGLAGALGATLAAVEEALAGEVRPSTAAAVEARVAAIGGRISEKRAAVERAARDRYGPAPLDPPAAMHAVASGLPDDAVVVEEAITAGLALRTVLRLDRPRSYVHTIGGGLGWGVGAAIGTRLGDPSRPVVAVLGDGCTMFGLQGLWSAVRYRVPVTFVVVNNGEYRTLKETLDGLAGPSAAAGTYVGLDLPGLDWQAGAKLFGMASTRVAHTEELRALVAGAGDRTEPLLVEVPVTAHGGRSG
ncbi:thiamine pyrophosphate-binding protein [Cryptosporangium phraense]|uniref:Thiamine pyrophosphate-binding protein n=1 Tax=Cryptosporangium phraense TaxID=2593070 RepID=A0A545AVS6_9ACTN|nr:thiamine pyrophosphate-binding protein [Cryptosporangium phraense]TQS45439.1 thiamine pyrophosphate-binding protein [Cryptosporangium phraense]